MIHIEQDAELMPIKILVVDDEPGIQKIFCIALEQQKHYVRSVSDGREALLTLMQEDFDVLIVDLNMDGMDGITFLQEALKIWPWISVIIVSGYITEDAARSAGKLGITHIMNKPVQLKTLCDNVVQEYLLKQERQKDLPTENALILMRNHLNILTRLSQDIIGSETLSDVLLEFSNSIAATLPSHVVGILLINEENTLLMSAQKPVSQNFINNVQKEMITRYIAISGNELRPDSIVPTIKSDELQEDGAKKIGSIISVPTIIDKNVHGLLTLASEQDNAYQPSDISLLYHAANHISTAFVALKKMQNLVTCDPLTGAFNRIRLNEELERAWLTSNRYNYSMAIIIVDIDHFKTLNDTFGHNIGDEILCAFAEIMQDASRTTDIIARYGGDEFVAVLPRADQQDAISFGERLMKLTRQYTLEKEGNKIRLSISAGISTSLNHTQPSSYSELLIQADKALYTAKNSGRNRICIWPDHICHSSIKGTNVNKGQTTTENYNDVIIKTVDQPNRILLIDDEEPILRLIKSMLNLDGYEVDTFTNATDAIKSLKARKNYYHVLLTDLGLPDMSGIEVLHHVNDIDDSIIKIVISGQATVDNAINALREGAHDFIQKPVIKEQLSSMVKHALEFYKLKQENTNHQMHLEQTVSKRSAQLVTTLDEIKKSYEFTLEAMVAMLDARERHTAKHSMRTRSLSIILAKHIGVSQEDVRIIAAGALLHDIGKIGIPDSILLKEGPLTEEQWIIMKNHPQIGYNILKTSPYLKEAAQIVYQHQERYDGTGYPQKLKGKTICLGARIFAVIDAYDAMRSARVYCDPLSSEAAIADLEKNSGTQFDPKIVDAFNECRLNAEKLFNET